MIIIDTTTPGVNPERQVILTDRVADSWAEEFGVSSLSDIGEEDVRTLYDTVSFQKSESKQDRVKTRVCTEDGEIELDPYELGSELFGAMMPG